MNLGAYIGIPYQNRGSTFAGCDCWGLVWLWTMEERHILLPRYEGYEDANGQDIGEYISERWDSWESVKLPNIELGDVVALTLGGLPVHCGIYVGRGNMLHILEGRMSCLESIDKGFWKNCIARIGRWKS